jgi:DNA-binding Xre family transcriptional regulator
MSQIDDMVAALKAALRSRAITYAALATKLELSESSVKRMFARSNFTLKRLAQICEVAEVELSELVIGAQEGRRDIDELTEQQEQTLVADTKLLLVAFLLLNYRSVESILAAYRISELEMIRLLAKLDRLQIIHLLPGNQVRMRLSRTFSWRQSGPIQRLFENSIQSDFFQSRFSAPNELRLVVNGMISEQSLAHLHDRLRRIAAEFEDSVREDYKTLQPDASLSTMVLAVRPWAMKLFQELRR